MLIISSEVTEETSERLRQFQPFELSDRNIVINVGNSNFDESLYPDFEIINKSSAVKNSVNKKTMFELFKKNKINCLNYLDLKKLSGKIKAVILIILGNKLVIRGNGLKISRKFKDLKNYATKKENKILEYRAIVFKDKIIRMMVKIPKNKSFQLKQNNCEFIDININKIPETERLNIINSVKCLGLDLAGVDVLINDKYKWLVCETNSGMSLSPKSCKKLFQELNPINIFNYLDKL